MMTIDFSMRGHAAVVTLDRQEALNALSFDILHELANTITRVASSGARVLIVTGAGTRAFCAGADIKELTNRSMSDHRWGAEFGQRVFALIEDLPIPSIAVINGYAFGGGLELALACTFRLATANARLSLPEIKLGLIPGYGGTQRLPRVIGEARALEMILTGRMVNADEALQMGLVSRIVDGDPVDAGLSFAASFIGYSLPVLDLARRAVTRAHDTPLKDGLKIEADLSTLAYQTADSTEGMAAFMEKRKPEFRDE